MRKINQEGLDHIKRWEGLKTQAYRDVAGVVTLGYGHTAMAGPPVPHMGMSITPADAEQILRNDLGQYEKTVEQAVKVPLTDNQFAALVSFCFNVGPAAFRKSTLLKKLNAGNYDAVPGELAKWNRAGGKVVAGLSNRRAAEAGLWAKGNFVSTNTVPAAPAKPPIVTVDNAVKVATPLSALVQAFTSGPAQIVLAVAFALGAAFLLWRWYQAQREAST